MHRATQHFPKTFQIPHVSSISSTPVNFQSDRVNVPLPQSVPRCVIRSTIVNAHLYTSNSVPVAPQSTTQNLVDANTTPSSVGYFPQSPVEFIPSPSVAYQNTSRSIPSIPADSAANAAQAPRLRNLHVSSSNLHSLPSDFSANAETRPLRAETYKRGAEPYKRSAETHDIPSDTMAFYHDSSKLWWRSCRYTRFTVRISQINEW